MWMESLFSRQEPGALPLYDGLLKKPSLAPWNSTITFS
ncbi:hypothetical protein M2277_004470 [Paenibacillus sp. LBL]|nr:hypothetical protein [Paenibacillus sp. LBL]